MPRRHRHPPLSRLAIWACALALLLRAALPMLAAAAAHAHGVALAEVCPLYGVRAEAHEHAGHDAPAQPRPAHAGDHCPLSGLPALAGAAPAAAAPHPSGPVAAEAAGVARCAPAGDACARWLARLGHSPPPSI